MAPRKGVPPPDEHFIYKANQISLRLLLLGLCDDAIDVGIDVLVSRVEVAYHDTDDLCPPEACRRAEALLYILDLESHALGEFV